MIRTLKSRVKNLELVVNARNHICIVRTFDSHGTLIDCKYSEKEIEELLKTHKISFLDICYLDEAEAERQEMKAKRKYGLI